MDLKTLLFIITAVAALNSIVANAFAEGAVPRRPHPVAAAASEVGESWNSCGSPLHQIYYSANFQWKNSGNLPETKRMQVKIGVTAEGQARPVALITTASGDCQAICFAKSLDKSGPTSPVSMDLSCQGAQLGALTTPVTLYWATRPGTQPMLRFGSWLNGYQHAVLTVEFDRYSQPPHRTPALAQSTR